MRTSNKKFTERRFSHTITREKKIGIGEKFKKLSTFITFSHYRDRIVFIFGILLDYGTLKKKLKKIPR